MEWYSFDDLRSMTQLKKYISGFKFSHRTSIVKFQITIFKIKIVWRIKFQKHKLKDILENFDPTKTGYENMIANKYHRIFDVGNSCFKFS